MTIEFKEKFSYTELGTRVRAVLGVPEEVLTNGIISSSVFNIKASKYINKIIEKFEEGQLEIYDDLIGVAYIYYICYLLCVGMDARLPKQMENVNTKTILQSISWDEKALEMLRNCDDILDDILDDLEENRQYGNTFALLSNESEYPNTNI